MSKILPESNKQSKKLFRQVLDFFALPPELDVAAWADSYRYLSSEASSKRGKWVSMPFQVAPMKDVTNVAVESLVLMWASQIAGKTEVLNNTIGRFIDLDPSPMLLIQPTVEMSQSWSKERFTPMVRDTPKLRGRIRDARSRDSGNTILHKQFPGGHLSIVGANAPAGLAMRPVRIVICDEVDRYPVSAGVEGDPIMLAEKRTESFSDAIKIKTSTPTIKGISRIESEFSQTDQNYWYVPCPKCGVFQTLKWAGVQWPENKPEEAVYECENGCKWTDAERGEAIQKGEWRPTAPFTGKRGYHLSGIYCLFKAQRGYTNRLHQMAAKFMEAKTGGKETLKTWTNTFLAETWEEDAERPAAMPLLERCEVYGPVLPAGVLVLVISVDTQRDRLEMETVGFGLNEESWGIRYDVFMGNPLLPAVWQQVEMALEREYDHPCGVKLKVAAGCFDTGHLPDAVYNFVRPRKDRRMYATKGSALPGSPLVSLPKKSGVRKVTLFMVGTDTAKGVIYGRLKQTIPGPGYMHFPIGYTKEYFHGLTAERLVTEYRRGFPVRVWKCFPDGARNEPLDIRVGCLAAIKILNPAWQQLATQLEVKTKDVAPVVYKEPEEPKPDPVIASIPQRRPVVMRRRNWVNRW